MESAVVIGGGITGFSIAYNLAKRGIKTTLLEKKYPSSGSTGRCSGGIRNQWSREHEIKLARESIKILEKLSAELNFNMLFRQGGHIILAEDEKSMKNLVKDTETQRDVNVKTKILNQDQIKRILPFIDITKIVGGTLNRKEGVCHPFSLLYGYQHGFKKLGGKVLKFTKAEKLDIRNSEVKGVKTHKNTFEADFVVVAAGAYSKELLKTIGINIQSKVLKTEILATEPLKFFIKPMVFCKPSMLFFNQTIRGEVIGGASEPSNEGYNLDSSLEFLRTFSKKLRMIAPPLRRVKVLRSWAGLQEFSPDESPIYGKTEIQNLYVACADSGKAFTFAPKIGEYFAELITEGQTSWDMTPFSLKRFEKKVNQNC